MAQGVGPLATYLPTYTYIYIYIYNQLPGSGTSLTFWPAMQNGPSKFQAFSLAVLAHSDEGPRHSRLSLGFMGSIDAPDSSLSGLLSFLKCLPSTGALPGACQDQVRAAKYAAAIGYGFVVPKAWCDVVHFGTAWGTPRNPSEPTLCM